MTEFWEGRTEHARLAFKHDPDLRMVSVHRLAEMLKIS